MLTRTLTITITEEHLPHDCEVEISDLSLDEMLTLGDITDVTDNDWNYPGEDEDGEDGGF